jgi:S1-C subfamily serine protease
VDACADSARTRARPAPPTHAAFALAAVATAAPAPPPAAAADASLLASASGARPSLAEATRAVTPAAPLPAAEQSVVDLFERLTYSVVNVVDITVTQAGLSRPGAQVDVPEGNGTGIVWNKEGDIVTNYHVLAGVLGSASTGRGGVPSGRRIASVARVTLLGGDGKSHEYVAELVGADRAKDIAVLRIAAPAELLRPLPRGASASVRVGQTVLAIGNPFGFDHTLTTGVVSGLDRTVQSAVGSLISGGIQTDAAINPGNSGGPLLNSEGELVGLNTAIFTATGLSSGVGFAIPVDTVVRVVPQLIEFGRVVRPSLNVALAPESIASQLRVKGGALVQAVPPGSAAAAAGLLPTRRGLGGIVTGDVIVGIDDDPVRSPAELADLVERRAIGDTVTLRVVRGVGGDATEQLIDVRVVLEKETGAPQ